MFPYGRPEKVKWLFMVAMKLWSAIVVLLLHSAVGLIKAERRDGAVTSSRKKICPPETYFSSYIPGCVACPEDCHNEAVDDIVSCLTSCSSKKILEFFTSYIF